MTKNNSDSKNEQKFEITTKTKLKEYLLNVRDKMTDGSAAPVYALSAINYVLSLPKVYSILDEPNKEIARDIWLRIKQSGFQIKNPILLFGEEDSIATK